MRTATQNQTTVLAVDDCEAIVDGMRRRGRRDLRVVEWARTAEGGASLAIDLRPDVVSMDVSGVGNPWRAIARIHDETGGEVPVLIVTGGSLLTYADQAIAHGASGIVAKADNSIEIVAAIKRVARGKEHWDHPWGDRVHAIRHGDASQVSLLTPEDCRVIHGIAEGLSREAIAELLGRSERAIRSIITDLRERLDVTTDAAMIVRLLRLGWIDSQAFL